MSEENVELVRRGFAWNREARDAQQVAEAQHLRPSRVEGSGRPELKGAKMHGRKALVGIIVGAASIAMVAAAPGGAASATLPDDPAFSMRQSCGTVDFVAGLPLQGVSGVYTEASVSAPGSATSRVNCPSARKLVRKWSDQPEEPIWPLTNVAGFRCELLSGSEILKLRCRNRNDGRKRVKATLHH